MRGLAARWSGFKRPAPEVTPAFGEVFSARQVGAMQREACGGEARVAAFGTKATHGEWSLCSGFAVTECAVCLESFSPSSVIRGLPCGHAFHDACVERWATIRETCPLCREVVTT